MMSAYVKFWKNFANFKGRSSRSDYWFAVLGNIIVSLVLSFVCGFLAGALDLAVLSFIPFIYSVAIFIPSIAIAIRRLHDINKSGWFYLMTFIPLVGSFIVLVFMCLPTVEENNQYGTRV